MEVRVLGARQGESRFNHFGSLLVDGVLALDAGSLTSMLTLQEQSTIQSILITHQHYDHIKDLATLGFNLLGKVQVKIYCTCGVRAAIGETILNERIWLNFFNLPTPEMPVFVHEPVEVDRTFTLGNYRICPVPAVHAVPAIGYAITSPTGETLLYTGDCGPGCGKEWSAVGPDLLITEVTYSNAYTSKAIEYGHLSPQLLAKELEQFRSEGKSLPRIAIVHVSPDHERQIVEEMSSVAKALGIKISLPGEGSIINVQSMP